MTEKEELEKLAQCLNWFDDGRSLGHTVVNLFDRYGDNFIIRGDGVDYTKEEAIEECDRRITRWTESIKLFRKEIDEIKGEPGPDGVD